MKSEAEEVMNKVIKKVVVCTRGDSSVNGKI